MAEAIVAYFTRLTGAVVTGDTAIRLTSLQIGAAHSWLCRQAAPFAERVLMTGRFTLAELLDPDGAPSAEPTRAVVAVTTAPATPSPPGLAVGIDIELVAHLPDAADYRVEAFYTDHFTDQEISHCISQADPRQSFCGIWAAKEAVRKALGSRYAQESLKQIAIAHDGAGAPQYPGAALSLSHAGGICVAVCAVATPPA
jgi:phosphopantetheine--protein transferase-like protein